MDFKKFISPSITPSSPGYIILKGFRGTFRGYELTSIRMQDAETIMKWRNEQIAALRQSAPLTATEQKNYFEKVVKPSLSQKQPELILLRFTFENILIGYGGLVHIDWTNQHAEVPRNVRNLETILKNQIENHLTNIEKVLIKMIDAIHIIFPVILF